MVGRYLPEVGPLAMLHVPVRRDLHTECRSDFPRIDGAIALNSAGAILNLVAVPTRFAQLFLVGDEGSDGGLDLRGDVGFGFGEGGSEPRE